MAGLILLGILARPAAGQDSTFLLVSEDPARTPSPFLGNGRIGVVIPALGLGASASFVAGLYDLAPSDVPRIAAVPAWNAIAVFDGERRLDSTAITAGAVREYRQVVDMRTGTARTTYEWVNGSRRTGVAVESFVSRADSHVAAIRLDLAPRFSGRMRVRFAIAGRPPPARLPLATLPRADPGWRPADIWYPGHMVVRSRSATRVPGGARLSLTSTPEGRTLVLAQGAAVTWPSDLPGAGARTRASADSALVELSFDAVPGRTYTFTQTTAFVRPGEDAGSGAGAEAQAAAARGWDALAAENALAWRRRWETDIEVHGDPRLQRVVRSMLFYLLTSGGEGTALGIPPMGLSSAGYYGHIFWDSDTWMFPSLLVTHPDIAHALVAFRQRTLGAARANARANGYQGAMYPWEADERGQETTPHFAVQNAKMEIHVNGDVALAQWQYYLATGDSAWLAARGYPVIRETANFWVSRARLDTADGRYHIDSVVSVHEGLIGVSDDAYTNAVARKNLEIAGMASARIGKPADPRWGEVAARLHLPYDSASEYYRTYEGAPDSTLGAVTPLLSYPLGVPMSERAKRAQLQQAVRRLLAEGPGAMMGSTLLSVDAAELGDRALLDSLLPHSYEGHLRGPFLMLSETPTNDAVNFVTGAGGFLQQVIYGWTGLRLGEGGLEPAFAPLLPSRVTRLVLRNVYSRGRRYDIVVDSTGRRVVPHAPPETR
ncbi:MAG: glycoside hydrolase family 65 protein [Gemmatimonadales bacterium]|nr:glycoside hydrolase family 65 protein [Gemmatimonadales bacterium]